MEKFKNHWSIFAVFVVAYLGICRCKHSIPSYITAPFRDISKMDTQGPSYIKDVTCPFALMAITVFQKSTGKK